MAPTYSAAHSNRTCTEGIRQYIALYRSEGSVNKSLQSMNKIGRAQEGEGLV